jgi:lysozyme
MKNKHIKTTHISERKTRDIIRLFCLDIEAKKTAELIGVSHQTVNPGNRSPETKNLEAFLWMIRNCEGTAGANGYAVCFGYKHTIQNFSDHPYKSEGWKGEPLSDTMCRNAGINPPCVSTAAGAYQIKYPTWYNLRLKHSGLTDFSPANQDRTMDNLFSNN